MGTICVLRGIKEHDFGLVCVQLKLIYSEPLLDGSSASIDHREVRLDHCGSNLDEQMCVVGKLVISMLQLDMTSPTSATYAMKNRADNTEEHRTSICTGCTYGDRWRPSWMYWWQPIEDLAGNAKHIVRDETVSRDLTSLSKTAGNCTACCTSELESVILFFV